MPKVGAFGSYQAFSKDTNRKGDTEETSFSGVLEGRETGEMTDSTPVSGTLFNDMGQLGSMAVDFNVYTFFGKIRSLESISGRNVNIEV